MNRLQKSDSFVTRRVGEETLLVPLAQARADLSAVLLLEGIGPRVWELLDARPTEEELLQAVLSEFDVTPEVAATDLSGFLNELRQMGAVTEIPLTD